jgi:predicted LPLAT superfamily acyltransferase
VDFLGGRARLPVGPWQLASALQVPVIVGFGCYVGDNRYAAHFELFAEKVTLPRLEREAAIKQLAQRFAKRLEYYAHLAPYNWFNFYDYWPTTPAQTPTDPSDEFADANASDGQRRPNPVGAGPAHDAAAP